LPKTGGDSISRFLCNNVPGAHHPHDSGKHWSSWKKKGLEGHYKFAFVREPVSWFRSYYAFIQQYYIKPHGKYPVFEAGMFHPMRRWERYDYSSFEAMVESVYADDPSYYTRLVEWMVGPQDAHMMNFIGKQENLSEDLGKVLKTLGLGHLIQKFPNAKRMNQSESDFNVPCGTIDLIHSQEHAIYRRFGYKKR
jgi:hypothetical protein